MDDDLFEIDLYFTTTWPSADNDELLNEDSDDGDLVINGVIDDDLPNFFSIDIDEDLANFFSIDMNEDIDHQHACNPLAAVMNSLELLRFEDDASLSMEQCAICLEEFYNGREPKLLIRTECLHVFHEDCMVKWLQHCNVNQSYSCPLCRCQISSKN